MVDFSWNDEESAFRATVRAWLEKNLAGREAMSYQHNDVDVLLTWEAALRDAGLNAVSWPTEYGGQGFDAVRLLIFTEEYDRALAPRRLNFPALGLLGPVLMAVGTPEQRAELLPRILSCEDVWCQGFSEPEAGSDLASLRSTATRDGDHYVLNGQKTWCSNGSRANKMFCLVRTDPNVQKRKGISFLLVDLSLPGVEIVPIKQVSGASSFCEVFLSDVRVPVNCLVGAENDGWGVAGTTLGIERGASRYPAPYFQHIIEDIKLITKRRPGGQTATDRVAIARMQADVDCWQVSGYASATSERPGLAALNAVFKLSRAEILQPMYEYAARALGTNLELGVAGLPAAVAQDFHDRYWHTRAASIYGGTSQIQRSIIGERILGLPKEPSA